MIKLGSKVRDRVTGLTGIATQKTEYLNGCVQIGICPKLKKGEINIDVWNIDESQVEVVGKGINIKKKDTGGASVRALKPSY